MKALLQEPTIVCLMGPTASGKTQLAIDLVQRFPFEFISVDSAMIYRGMDIGTAKPTPDILKIAPHRLIDIRDPKDPYSAAQFCADAEREIQAVFKAGRIPLLVGGTMMYFRSLLTGLSDLPSADEVVRAQLLQEAEDSGWAALHRELLSVDPVAAERIHPNDTQRLQRALEVYRVSGKSLSAWQAEGISALNCKSVCIAVSPQDRAVLHERIALRFDEMLTQGFMAEVDTLYARGDLNLAMPSIRSVGYRQAWESRMGLYPEAEIREKSIIATRQLAKRQLTWLRHWQHELQWFESMDTGLLDKVIQHLEM